MHTQLFYDFFIKKSSTFLKTDNNKKDDSSGTISFIYKLLVKEKSPFLNHPNFLNSKSIKNTRTPEPTIIDKINTITNQ